MYRVSANAVKALAAASVLVLASGCATTDELDKMRSDIQKAQSDAAAAQSAADRAQSTAANAQILAERAMDSSREAQNCCAANSERIDRVFKKSMLK